MTDSVKNDTAAPINPLLLLRNLIGLYKHNRRSAFPAYRRVPLSSMPEFLAAYRSWKEGGPPGTSRVRVRGDRDPVFIRHRTSDFDVFCQVLLRGEYAVVPQLSDVRTIIDAGSNVGYSSRYFLRRFPKARVLAIEPDRANYETAEANLSLHRDRCEIVNAALWPRDGHVKTVRDFGDRREWAIRVAESSHSALDAVEALTVDAAMSRMGWHTIDILKIDIEGAEHELFQGDTSFMDHVRCCAIELHDAAAVELFDRVCEKHGFDIVARGETTVALRQER